MGSQKIKQGTKRKREKLSEEELNQRKRERGREYYRKNAQRINEQHRQYNRINAEKIHEQKREYINKNKEKIAKRQKEWVDRNADSWKLYQQQYERDHREERGAYKIQWRKDNLKRQRQKERESKQEWRKGNIEKCREYAREWAKKNLKCGGCGITGVNKRGDLCASCNPKSATRKRYDEKRPEIQTLRAVQAAFPQANIYHDTPIGTACGSNERPDIYFVRDWIDDEPPFWIVVEVDEGGHGGYGTTCEWKRVYNIPSLLATTNQNYPTLFIRFNPGTTDNVLKKRLPLLMETIKSMLPAPNSHAVSVAFLYYTKTYGQELYLLSNDELEEQLKLFTPQDPPSSSSDSN